MDIDDFGTPVRSHGPEPIEMTDRLGDKLSPEAESRLRKMRRVNFVEAHGRQPMNGWRYDIQYGPEGEANYAWIYDHTGAMVCTAKVYHAIAIVERMNERAAPSVALTEHELIKSAQKLLSGAMDELTVRVSRDDLRFFEVEYFGPIREWMRQAKRLQESATSRPDTDQIEIIAKWLHDETGHPEQCPGYAWPEHENDDGRRPGGFVKIVPTFSREFFRDIARRLIAGPMSRNDPVTYQQITDGANK